MTRFGYAIRTGGDQEIAGALAAGIEQGSPTGVSRHIPPDGKASSEAVRRVAMWQHSPEEWAAMTVKARYDYGRNRTTPRWARPMLAAWALVCYGVSRAYRAQDLILQRRAL